MKNWINIDKLTVILYAGGPTVFFLFFRYISATTEEKFASPFVAFYKLRFVHCNFSCLFDIFDFLF